MKYVEPVNSHAYPERNGSYITANPTTGLRGSWVPGEALEHPMREIVHVIQMAGLEPSSAELTQLYQAIMLLYPEVEGFLPLEGGTMEGSILANKDNAISIGSVARRLKEIFAIRFRGIADSADRLQTSRNINGIPFNGTSDITIPIVGFLPLIGGIMSGSINAHADNVISIGSVARRLKEIFAIRFRGIADSADRLQTSRNINGIPFNGTANISIPPHTAVSLGSSGYIKLYGSGLLIQWGTGNGAMVFPVAFPNACLTAQYTIIGGWGDETWPEKAASVQSISRTGITAGQPGWYSGRYLAIGY